MVPPIDKNGGASGALPGLHVAPSIADHEAVGERERAVAGGVLEHAGRWLAAAAPISIVMIADAEFVDRQQRRETRVHPIDHLALLRAARDVGLVGDDDEAESRVTQADQGVGHPRQHLELGLARRRIRLAVADERSVDYAVPVEEDGAANVAVDSHLVCAAFNEGCDTSRCHTTAWNASACGVIVAALMVGMITQASATCAVNPPSRPTTPAIRAPTCLAYCSARTRLGLTFRSRLPPPTEKTNTTSSAFRRLPCSHATNTDSHPSSLVRAVNSETLSTGV